MKKMYFMCMVNYNGQYYNAGDIINVKEEDVESMQKEGGFLVQNTPEQTKKPTKKQSKQTTKQQSSSDGELTPKPKPSRGTRRND